jgi:segregation and condensation protein A
MGARAVDRSHAWGASLDGDCVVDVAAPEAAFAEGGFVVELERFTGPIDLLLHLIREQDIDIFDIPISQITNQFLQAIEGVEALGLDRAGEFLEMAAVLVRIKAQMLMPRRTDAEGELEDPRAELVRRLLEYEHFTEVAQRLEEAQAERLRKYRRGFIPPRAKPAPIVELQITWEDFFAAALNVGERQQTPAEHHVRARAVPLEEKVGLILQTLARLDRIEFDRLVRPFGDRLHGVVTMLAGLELAKRREVLLRQSAPFAALWIYRRTLTDEERAALDVPRDEWVDALGAGDAAPGLEEVVGIGGDALAPENGVAVDQASAEEGIDVVTETVPEDGTDAEQADEAPDATDADH